MKDGHQEAGDVSGFRQSFSHREQGLSLRSAPLLFHCQCLPPSWWQNSCCAIQKQCVQEPSASRGGWQCPSRSPGRRGNLQGLQCRGSELEGSGRGQRMASWCQEQKQCRGRQTLPGRVLRAPLPPTGPATCEHRAFGGAPRSKPQYSCPGPQENRVHLIYANCIWGISKSHPSFHSPGTARKRKSPPRLLGNPWL